MLIVLAIFLCTHVITNAPSLGLIHIGVWALKLFVNLIIFVCINVFNAVPIFIWCFFSLYVVMCVHMLCLLSWFKFCNVMPYMYKSLSVSLFWLLYAHQLGLFSLSSSHVLASHLCLYVCLIMTQTLYIYTRQYAHCHAIYTFIPIYALATLPLICLVYDFLFSLLAL